MRVTAQDIIKLMNESINDDKVIIENYTKVVGILDKINAEQATAIFDNLVYNHELSTQWARKFQAQSNLFANQAKKGGAAINPMEISKLEGLQDEAEKLSNQRTELEVKIGKVMLEKGFIDQKKYDKYYPE